jgi:hypothetical protein
MENILIYNKMRTIPLPNAALPNFYDRARRGDESVVIVGESVMRLDDRGKLARLEQKLAAVRAMEALPLVPLLVTHFAQPELLELARKEGIVVVQSFEWG